MKQEEFIKLVDIDNNGMYVDNIRKGRYSGNIDLHGEFSVSDLKSIVKWLEANPNESID